MISVPGVAAINAVRTGPKGGPPLVFLHPVGLDLTWWGGQIDYFARDHDVIAFDMPNHGLSGKMPAQPSFNLMASALEGVLMQLGTGPAHLVGMSVGGMIAQHFALRRPELVSSLTLVATLCTFPAPVREALRERARIARAEGMAKIAQLSNERWFPPAFRERRPDMLDRATKSLLLQEPAFHASMWDMIAGLDLQAELSRITCPTLVVVGAEDGNAPLSAGKTIAGLIEGAVLHEIAEVGHFPPYEAPELFNALLHQFLTKDGRGPES